MRRNATAVVWFYGPSPGGGSITEGLAPHHPARERFVVDVYVLVSGAVDDGRYHCGVDVLDHAGSEPEAGTKRLHEQFRGHTEVEEYRTCDAGASGVDVGGGRHAFRLNLEEEFDHSKIFEHGEPGEPESITENWHLFFARKLGEDVHLRARPGHQLGTNCSGWELDAVDVPVEVTRCRCDVAGNAGIYRRTPIRELLSKGQVVNREHGSHAKVDYNVAVNSGGSRMNVGTRHIGGVEHNHVVAPFAGVGGGHIEVDPAHRVRIAVSGLAVSRSSDRRG